jgi:RNA polymerase sigma-70 factor, ECF subfamily
MRAYQDMVYSTARRITASESHAEDIAQDVFLKAFSQFEHLRSSPSAGGWLKTVATNLSLNHLARYRRRWRFFSEFTPAGEDEQIESPDFLSQSGTAADELLEGLDAESRQQRIEDSIARLPDHQRVPVVLHHFEGMSYQDIAAHLDVSVAKLKSDLHRGRLQLAHLLKKDK